MALYEHDPDGGGYDRPAYLTASTVTDTLFNAAAGSFTFLANSLPTVANPMPVSQDNSSSVTSGLQAATAPAKVVPKPRRPPRATKSKQPEPAQEPPSVQAPSTPEPLSEREKDDTSVGSLTAEEDQGPRRGNRERHAPKRFDGSDNNRPVKKKGARGGGQGGRTKGK